MESSGYTGKTDGSKGAPLEVVGRNRGLFFGSGGFLKQYLLAFFFDIFVISA